MAARKEISVEDVTREPQPKIETEIEGATYRVDVARAYDEANPELMHSWASGQITEETLSRKGQEVVKRNGKPVKDGMGDILVRQDRKSFEKKLHRQQLQSLADVSAVVNQKHDDGDGLSVDADLVQQAQPRQTRSAPMKITLDD